ncbi:GntR family transcriptional regulator [Aliiglaciecola sp. CAU 1673]|uniref:GntR family transcriptional regulator n=1 Tax=Aliiglaciecola sp. CAU 1673 TaxID=3032595 RepID=UPI0023DA7C57|nr:GntR family transcriptional regulator [Aliiglaciecola sp. CAU 1673]MDF2178594.1 GntR family transcriptional regulator [Aliiglaciecola sp. CAU 1673]
MPAIEHKTRTQLAAEAIREKILRGEIKAGEQLRQAALAEELNISRIPVREALMQLEAEGLVEFEAHKGATATKLSTDQVTELFELRALLETELLRLSIPKLQEKHLLHSEALLEKMAKAYDDKNSIDDWSSLNSQFHLSLYEAANRPLTFELVQNLNTNADRYVRANLMLAGGTSKAEAEHAKLLKLCRQGKTEAACALLRQHILSAADDIIDMLTEQ